MKTLKICGLAIFQLLSGIISLLVIYLIIVMFAAVIPNKGVINQDEDVIIYVNSNGVHTDLVLPVKTVQNDWKKFIDPKDYPQDDYPYISFGWGDKAFYIETPRWEDLTVKTSVNAMLKNSPCAMHVRYYRGVPREKESCVKLQVAHNSYNNLVSYIKSSFLMEDGKVVLIPNAGYWSTDQFYEAKGNYHLFNTCNNWTNEGLKAAQISTAKFAVFPKTILAYCREYASSQ